MPFQEDKVGKNHSKATKRRHQVETLRQTMVDESVARKEGEQAMNGKLFYLANENEYVFIVNMALTPSIKDTLQADMVERLGAPVAVISDCDSFEYLSGGH
jgi:hypothetical protein